MQKFNSTTGREYSQRSCDWPPSLTQCVWTRYDEPYRIYSYNVAHDFQNIHKYTLLPDVEWNGYRNPY